MKKKILITQIPIRYNKSVYQQLCDKRDITIDFLPFISIKNIDGTQFKEQRIQIEQYSNIIFTSRASIDNFFRICKELNITISKETQYYCTTELIAVYLSRFSYYKKRKIYFGKDNYIKELYLFVERFKKGKFLYPCSPEFPILKIIQCLDKHKADYELAHMYHVKNNPNIANITLNTYHIICFYTPGAIHAFLNTFKGTDYKNLQIGIYGEETKEFAKMHELPIHFYAPTLEHQSLINALDTFLQNH